jgi:hypothetical protein
MNSQTPPARIVWLYCPAFPLPYAWSDQQLRSLNRTNALCVVASRYPRTVFPPRRYQHLSPRGHGFARQYVVTCVGLQIKFSGPLNLITCITLTTDNQPKN